MSCAEATMCDWCLREVPVEVIEEDLWRFWKLISAEHPTISLENICGRCRLRYEEFSLYVEQCKANASLVHELLSRRDFKHDSSITIEYHTLVKDDSLYEEESPSDLPTVSGRVVPVSPGCSNFLDNYTTVEQIDSSEKIDVDKLLSNSDFKDDSSITIEYHTLVKDDSLYEEESPYDLPTVSGRVVPVSPGCSNFLDNYTTVEQVDSSEKIEEEPPVDIEDHIIPDEGASEEGSTSVSPAASIEKPLNLQVILERLVLSGVCTCCNKVSCSSLSKKHSGQRTGEKSFKCSVCQKTLSRSGTLKRHMRLHAGENTFKCSLCEKTFTQSGRLKNHMHVHAEKKVFECSFCKKTFRHSCVLKNHIRLHTGEKPFECSTCRKTFTFSSNLKTHMLIHTGERPFKCSFCKNTFRQSGSLKIHLRLHTGEKPYECSFCKKAFAQYIGLKNHMWLHTGEKPFECSLCKKSFTQYGGMKIHMRIHTGEKPYECSFCKKAFSQSGSLKIHIRIHTGERPFECSFCKKTFAQHSSLNIHLRLHTGEKPFECSICKKTFAYSNSLKQHLRVHICKSG